jgi:hypothetical protein
MEKMLANNKKLNKIKIILKMKKITGEKARNNYNLKRREKMKK